MLDAKFYHHRHYQDFKEYADKINVLLESEKEAKDKNEKTTIDQDTLDEFFTKNKFTHNHNLFISHKLPWKSPDGKTAEIKDIENMATKMRELEEKLNMTEGTHSNSPEYKAMKVALKAVNKGLKEGIAPDELGSRFEALQAASMDYVQLKGVGKQSTQRDKLRMDAALDICSMAVEGMDYYASKERLAEIQSFEQQHFNRQGLF